MDQYGAEIVSGEGVALDLRTAGLCSRALAAALDFAIQFAGFLVLALITLPSMSDADEAAQRAVVLVEVVVVLVGYPVVLEWLCRGRTVGKIALGLRVVRDDGGPIAFRHALVRGLAGMIIDKPGVFLPVSTFASMVTISANRSEKRIGDLMAGTIVLNERAAPQPLAVPSPWVVPQLRPWVLGLDMQRLDDRLALSLRQFLSRAHAMSPSGQAALGEALRERVLAAVSPPPPPGVPTSTLLQSVLAERRRRAGEPVAGAVPAYPARTWEPSQSALLPPYGPPPSPYGAPPSYLEPPAQPPSYSAPPSYVGPSPHGAPDWSDDEPPSSAGRPTFTPPS